MKVRKFFAGVTVPVILFILGNAVFAQDAPDKLNMLEIVISNLIARVEALEKRVSALEKNLSAGVSKMPKKEFSGRVPAKPSVADGFEDIGSGFFVKNVRFNPFGDNILFTGEMANRAGKNYRFAKFILEIYDDRDLLVKKEEFTIPDLPKESVKPFEAMLAGVEAGSIYRYVIRVAD
ncbi:MAG: hypothetical protein HRF42_08255 [Candidatus Brocadia sp.]|jgi:hypothetical protein